MRLKILYFGQAAEIVGSESNEVSLSDNVSLLDLQRSLFLDFPNLETLNLKWAVNQELINGDLDLKEGDEISVLPPFAGG